VPQGASGIPRSESRLRDDRDMIDLFNRLPSGRFKVALEVKVGARFALHDVEGESPGATEDQSQWRYDGYLDLSCEELRSSRLAEDEANRICERTCRAPKRT
jgi:hypothetical protein